MKQYNALISLVLSVCLLLLCGCKSTSSVSSETVSADSRPASSAAAQQTQDAPASASESAAAGSEDDFADNGPVKPPIQIFSAPGSGAPSSGSTVPGTDSSQSQKESESEPVKYIALTFDDGPNTDNTDLLLDKLRQYQIPATFMLKGSNINEQTAGVMKRIAAAGCEIGNHSFEHTTTLYTSGAEYAEYILEDYHKTEALIQKYAGVSSAFYRPPFILVNDVLRSTIPVPLISGTGCNDWEASVTAEQRAETILSSVGEGGIILLHDTSGNLKTVDALDLIIPAFLEKGYTFVTVTDLFAKYGVTASKGVLYKSVNQTLG